MTLYFSPSTKGFYDTTLTYPNYPNDCIEISLDFYHQAIKKNHLEQQELDFHDGELIFVAKKSSITWDDIRRQRNELLHKSDYTQMIDYAGDKIVWTVYRQALRDITVTFDSPEKVVWPTKPNDK